MSDTDDDGSSYDYPCAYRSDPYSPTDLNKATNPAQHPRDYGWNLTHTFPATGGDGKVHPPSTGKWRMGRPTKGAPLATTASELPNLRAAERRYRRG